MKKILSFLAISLLLAQNLMAQQRVESTVEMADQLRADGKIYVVVAVLGIILLALFAYLIRLDGKIGRAEKEIVKEIKP